MTYRRRGNERQEKREEALQYTCTKEKGREYERERKTEYGAQVSSREREVRTIG